MRNYAVLIENNNVNEGHHILLLCFVSTILSSIPVYSVLSKMVLIYDVFKACS